MADEERARLIGDVALGQAGDVDHDRVARRAAAAATGRGPAPSTGPGPCSGVSVGPGTGAALARQHLPVEELAVEAAEADRALVAVQPHVVPELAEDVELEAARHEQLRRVLHGGLRLLAGEADALELPRALARARRPQRGHAVGRLGARQQPAVAEVGRGGQHVELEAQAQALRQADSARAPRAARAAT